MSSKRQRALENLIRARRVFREELRRTPRSVRRAYSDSQPRGEDGRWIASGRIDAAAKAGSAKAAELFKEVSGAETGKLETWLQDAGMSKTEVQSAKAKAAGGSGEAAGEAAAAERPRTPVDSSRRHDEVSDLRNSEKPVHFTTEDFTLHGYSPADALPGDTVSGEDWQEQLAKHPSVVGYFSPSLGWAKDLPNGDGVPEGIKARIFGVGDEDEDVEPVPPEQFGLTRIGDGAGRDMFAVADPDLWADSKAKFGERGEEKGVQAPPPSSSAAINAARSRPMEIDPQNIGSIDKLHPDLVSMTSKFHDTKGRSRGKVRDETHEKSELIFNGKPEEMAAIGVTKVVAPGDQQFPDKAIFVSDRAKYDAYMQKEAASQAFGSPVDGTVLPSSIINNARKNGRIVNLAEAGIGQVTGPDGKSLYFVNDQDKYKVARKAASRINSGPGGMGMWVGGEDYEENAAHFERGAKELVPMGRSGKYGPVGADVAAKPFEQSYLDKGPVTRLPEGGTDEPPTYEQKWQSQQSHLNSGPEGGLPKDEFVKTVRAIKADMRKYGEEISELTRDQFIDGYANMGWDDYATKHGTNQRQVLRAAYDKLVLDAAGTEAGKGGVKAAKSFTPTKGEALSRGELNVLRSSGSNLAAAGIGRRKENGKTVYFIADPNRYAAALRRK